MRDYSKEFADRVQYIRNLVEESGVDGIVFGNSGGKDSALVGILSSCLREHRWYNDAMCVKAQF